MTVLGVLVAIIPFVFAAMRAASTGSDFRYLWVAAASTLMAGFVLGVPGRPMSANRKIIHALAGATASAYAAGSVQGAENFVSVFIVSLGFAVCSTVGIAMILRDRALDTDVAARERRNS